MLLLQNGKKGRTTMLKSDDMRRYILVITAIIAMTGCSRETYMYDEGDECRVELSLKMEKETKGALTEDFSALKSMQLCIYRNGLLVNSGNISGTSKINFSLVKGYEYNLYILGNSDIFNAPLKESRLTEIKYEIPHISLICKYNSFPMIGKLYGLPAINDYEEISIRMRKLVSRLKLSVNTSALPGLEVKSVRILQSPLVLYPFLTGGSRVFTANQVTDGDYATEEECNMLNLGEEILLYTFENLQGDLLPGNIDSWAKVPEAMDDYAELCTYAEMECEFNDSSPFEGSVKYRFYLGNDEYCNFDVTGGKEQSVCVILTNKGLEMDSWKVEADYSSKVSSFSRLEVEGVANLCVGGSTVLKVRKYTDIYFDGVISELDTIGEEIDCSEVLWELPYYDEAEASLTQDGVLTGIRAGSVTVNVSLLSDSSIKGAGAVTIRERGDIQTGYEWDSSGNDISIEF